MRILVAYNPTAGTDGRDDVRERTAALERAGHAITTQSVKEEGWQRILRRPFELIVVAGGDGTVAEVFKQLPGAGLPVAIVPIGSANNVARSLELTRRERTRFDICSLTWDGGANTFVESCGGGLFAEMIVRAEDSQSDPSGEGKGTLGLRSVLEVATAATARKWRVNADGRDVSGEYIASRC
jgi:diacylglycerol kinase family enzyme